jgi:hypothetical protein
MAVPRSEGKWIMKRFLALLATPLAAQPAGQALPEWLAGAWHSQEGANWADEVWVAPRGGMMQGIGRAGMGAQLQTWEFMRIARRADGTLVYLAQPRGVPPAEFPAVSIGEDAIEFANPAHDYPQRIRYWRQGQLLMAEIAKLDGSQAMRWNFRPVAQ